MNPGHEIHRLAILMMVVCGCGGGPLGTGDETGADLGRAGGGDAAVGSFDCATYADAHCALIQRCAPLLDISYFDGNLAACRARVLSQCMPFQSSIDATRGTVCITTLRNIT